MPSTYYSDFPPVDQQRTVGRPPYAAANASLGQTSRSTKQKIHSYTNAYNHHLQEKIPPNKPYIGLRPAYRPHYALCVILAGVINVLSGVIMTAIAWSNMTNNSEPYRILRVLGPVVLVIGIIFLLCGGVLLCHFRRGKRRAKRAIERGHPYDPEPHSHRRARLEEIPKEMQKLPAGSATLKGPTTGMSDYSYYDQVVQPVERRTEAGRRRGENVPKGGDWKYVSHVRDATFAPKPPREERKSNKYAAEPLHKEKYRITTHGQNSRSQPTIASSESEARLRTDLRPNLDQRY